MAEIAEIESLEIRLLLEAIHSRYGYDFRHYSRSAVKRRLVKILEASGADSLSEMQGQVLRDAKFFETVLLALSINVTEMFRNPPFFRALREAILPELSSQEVIKVWHAGCSTGEEVYSMAILLEETGLYGRSRIYATDYNEVVLRHAREGIFPLDRLQSYTSNYQQSGGDRTLAGYFSIRYDHAILDRSLKRNILFADHNLAGDSVFGEMDLVVCRNVLIYFDRALQDRAVGLFTESLRDGGFLCLGASESLRWSAHGGAYEEMLRSQRIFRRRARTTGRVR